MIFGILGGLPGLLSAFLLPVWTATDMSAGASARADGLSWPAALSSALERLPRINSGGLGDPTLDALLEARSSGLLGQNPRMLDPLIDELGALPAETRIQTPEALGQLPVPALARALGQAASAARESTNARAEGLMRGFRQGLSIRRADFVHDAMGELIMSEQPYLSSTNLDLILGMHKELVELREGRVKGLLRHAGDALAQEGWPGVKPMPERLEVSALEGYQNSPYESFPFFRQAYLSAHTLKPIHSSELRVLGSYQDAINHFVAKVEEPKDPKQYAQIKVQHLGGRLAHGERDGMGIASIGHSFPEEDSDTPYWPGPGRGSFMPVELYIGLTHPKPAPLDMDVTSINLEARSFLRDAQQEVYRDFGVLIRAHPGPGPKERRMPIEEILGNGLFRHIAVTRLVSSMMPVTRVRKRSLEESLRGLGFKDGEWESLRDAWILFVGDGAGVLPKIMQDFYGVLAVAMDWWYALTPDEINRHIRMYGPHGPTLAGAVLEDLPARVVGGFLPTPSFSGNSFREVILNDWLKELLIFNRPWAWEALQEAIRITEPGGRIRFRIEAQQEGEIRQLMGAHFPDYRVVPVAEKDKRGVVIYKPSS